MNTKKTRERENQDGIDGARWTNEKMFLSSSSWIYCYPGPISEPKRKSKWNHHYQFNQWSNKINFSSSSFKSNYLFFVPKDWLTKANEWGRLDQSFNSSRHSSSKIVEWKKWSCHNYFDSFHLIENDRDIFHSTNSLIHENSRCAILFLHDWTQMMEWLSSILLLLNSSGIVLCWQFEDESYLFRKSNDRGFVHFWICQTRLLRTWNNQLAWAFNTLRQTTILFS